VVSSHSDNRSEYALRHFIRSCYGGGIAFSRACPYCKNGGAHVEEKNNSVFHKFVDDDWHDRREGVDL
jgi:hypothetical protein